MEVNSLTRRVNHVSERVGPATPLDALGRGMRHLERLGLGKVPVPLSPPLERHDVQGKEEKTGQGCRPSSRINRSRCRRAYWQDLSAASSIRMPAMPTGVST